MPIEIETKDELSISINCGLRSYKIFRMGSPIDSSALPSFVHPGKRLEWENKLKKGANNND